MKIKSLHIQNFQSHKNTILEFHDGVNAIIGLSDQGKSAVLRAFNWLINNKPAGDAFVSHWGGDTVVEIEFDDGTKIKRTKGSRNAYAISLPNRKPIVLEGFNQSVPDKVQQILNLHDFNLRFQHQGAFLLSENSGEVSRYLNKIARFDIIDKAISNIDSVLRQERQSFKHEQVTVDRLVEELKQFEYLSSAEKQVKQAEDLQETIEIEVKRYNALYDTIDEAKQLEQKILPFKELAGAKDLWGKCAIQLKELWGIQSKKSSLIEIKTQISQLKGQIQKLMDLVTFNPLVEALLQQDAECIELGRRAIALENLIIEFKWVEVTWNKYSEVLKAKSQLDSVTALKEEIASIARKTSSLEGIIGSIRAIKLIESQTHLEKLKAEFAALMPDVCPLCGK